MSVQLNFSTAGISLDDNIQLFPEGWYKVVIDNSGVMPLADKSSHALFLDCKIIEGPKQGQTYKWMLNMWHQSSEQAVNAARRDLNKLCHVVGIPAGVGQSAELHGRPFVIFLSINKRVRKMNDGSEKESEVNNVTDIRNMAGQTAKELAGGGAPPANPAPGTAPAAAAPAAAGAPPFAPPAAAPAPSAAPAPTAAPSPTSQPGPMQAWTPGAPAVDKAGTVAAYVPPGAAPAAAPAAAPGSMPWMTPPAG